MLSSAESKRYNRHLILKGFGKEAQLKLKEAKVLVIGAGGLGAPVLNYLTAAGVGKIGVVDNDVVELSNLQRQTLFIEDDLHKSKAFTAVERLKKQNPFVDFKVYQTRFTAENAFRLVKDYDIVVDGTDNFPTRYLINDVCVLKDKTNVHGSINEFQGQVAVFNAKQSKGRSANYRDLYPEPPQPDNVKNCSEAGVVGVLPGIIGSMQAMEVIKIITEIGEPLINKITFYDALTCQCNTLKFKRDAKNPLTGDTPTQKELIDYQQFCGYNKKEEKNMKSISVLDLKEMMDKKDHFTLIDVREAFEADICTLNAPLIPVSQVPEKHELFKQEGKVVVYCRSGARSANAIMYLEQNYGYDNLYNLEGGILAWAKLIDTSMQSY